VTAPYSAGFAADKPDLAGSLSSAHLTYVTLKKAGGVEYERVREAISRLIAAPPYG
jgi:hypothetical protein